MRIGWLEEREPDWPWRLALAPLAPAGWLYAAAAALARRRALGRHGGPQRLGCRVLSVGSLLVGGSGKTPAAAWLARGLRERGHRVVLASRGYGRRGGARVAVVSDGRRVQGRVETCGDEPLVLAAHAPGVPVLVGADRAQVGRRALTQFGADLLVLDDGFQHHRLHRDLDFVVLDGRSGLGNRRCLPAGPLRESVAGLRRAHAIGVVDGPLPDADAARIERVAPDALRFSATRRPLRLRPLAGGRGEAPESLSGRQVGILAGVAGPGGVRRSVEALGAQVVAERLFADHHRYRRRDVADLAARAPLWVTTEKDALKIPAGWVGSADVRVLSIELAVEEPGRLLDWVEASLRR